MWQAARAAKIEPSAEAETTALMKAAECDDMTIIRIRSCKLAAARGCTGLAKPLHRGMQGGEGRGSSGDPHSVEGQGRTGDMAGSEGQTSYADMGHNISLQFSFRLIFSLTCSGYQKGR
jgi:hypothetical protein